MRPVTKPFITGLAVITLMTFLLGGQNSAEGSFPAGTPEGSRPTLTPTPDVGDLQLGRSDFSRTFVEGCSPTTTSVPCRPSAHVYYSGAAENPQDRIWSLLIYFQNAEGKTEAYNREVADYQGAEVAYEAFLAGYGANRSPGMRK